MVSLHASSYESGAEMDAFSTVTLDSTTTQPGASLGFGSGTNYNLLVAPAVPEPGAPLMILTGLAALVRSGGPNELEQVAHLTVFGLASAQAWPSPAKTPA